MAKDRSQNLSELLSAYLDGELDEATTAKVVAHIERDASAGLLLRELRETRSLLQDLPRESAPTDFAESVVAAVERQALLGEVGDESPAGSARRRFGPIRSAAAIVLLVGAAGSWIYWQIDRVQIAQMPVEQSATRSGSLAESEPAMDQLSTASSSGVEDVTIKAPVAGAFTSTLAKKAESIEQFDHDGEDESEDDDQVVMLGAEWSGDGIGDAGSGPPEFGLLRRLRAAPASLPIAANFVQQLEQGRPSETLARFQFDGESNSLVLDFDDRHQREQFARGVDAFLVSNSFLNVADPIARSQVADPAIQNVYLPGDAGINHTESDTTQILLLAPMEVLEELLDEYTDTTKYPIIAESVELKMGDIQVAGVDDARRTMKAMAVPQLREKMLVDDLPRAEVSRRNAETSVAGRTVEEWKFYYDRIEQDRGEVFGGQLAQTGQPLTPEFKEEAGVEESLQLSSMSGSGQTVAGDDAETSAPSERIQYNAASRSSEPKGELRAGDSEYDDVATEKRRARPAPRFRPPLAGSAEGENETRIIPGLTSGPIDKVDVGLVELDRQSGRRGGKGKASGSSRRAGNLTFILKMRVPAPVYELEGPPAPPDLKLQPSKDDAPSRSK